MKLTYSKNDFACDIWQNSETGKVNGISGNVDTNIIFNARFDSTQGDNRTNVTTTDTTVTIPKVTYRVRSGGVWLPEVIDTQDYAGLPSKPITDVAIKVSKGSVRYRVHVKGGGWLGYITGYDISNINKYAGNGKPIDAIEIYYTTPSDVNKALGYFLRAKYKVSPVGGGYYDWQYDTEKTNGQDGYAGSFGKTIDRLQILLSK